MIPLVPRTLAWLISFDICSRTDFGSAYVMNKRESTLEKAKKDQNELRQMPV